MACRIRVASLNNKNHGRFRASLGLREDAFGVAADIFSLGVTLVEVASGRAPGESRASSPCFRLAVTLLSRS